MPPCTTRAISFRRDYAEAHNNLGNILLDCGQLERALAQYDRAIAIRPDYPEAHFNRAEIRKFHPGDAELASLEALAARNDLPLEQRPLIHFALGKALDDSGDPKGAFEQWRRGNRLQRRRIRYDEAATARFFERVADVFGKRALAEALGTGDPSPLPVFIVGMPRSGTTLVEQILAGHPAIHAAGELIDLEKAATEVLGSPFPECAAGLDGATLRRIGQAYLFRLPALNAGEVRIVNKLPDNFLRVGLIRMMLPNARIIHTVRDPVDTCVSCYSKLFATGQHFSYELGELGRYYRLYRSLMAHWHSALPSGALLDVAYEDVVQDFEGQARRLVEYCGLPWDDRCLDFHKTARPVKTASAVQVRRPLFRSSVERWRKYEAGLSPLFEALGDIAASHAARRAA